MGSKSILVVDDDWNIGEVVVFLLASYGYGARYAPDGAVAFEMLDDLRPDLVLTDLMMPVLNGSELLQKIRTTDALAAMPVLVMSAVPVDIVRRKCPLATGFLGKPFGSAELLNVVRTILDRP